MIIRSLPVFLTDLLLARLAYAESPVFAPSIVAIGGYDPVTYFSQAKPVSRTVSGPDIAPRTTAQPVRRALLLTYWPIIIPSRR